MDAIPEGYPEIKEKEDYGYSSDFSLSFADEEDMKNSEAVKTAEADAEQAKRHAARYRKKLETLYNEIVPFLNLLMQQPKKEYLHWPNRVKEVKDFGKKLQVIITSDTD